MDSCDNWGSTTAPQRPRQGCGCRMCLAGTFDRTPVNTVAGKATRERLARTLNDRRGS